MQIVVNIVYFRCVELGNSNISQKNLLFIKLQRNAEKITARNLEKAIKHVIKEGSGRVMARGAMAHFISNHSICSSSLVQDSLLSFCLA